MTVSAVNVEEFEQKYVNDVYERLARSCITSNNVRNGCRLKRWDKVDEFLTSFPCSSIIADLGKNICFAFLTLLRKVATTFN